MKTFSVAEAKKHFSEIADLVVREGHCYGVTRRGKAVLGLVPIETAQAIEERGRPLGLAAMAGLLGDAPRFLDAVGEAWRMRHRARDRAAPRLR